VVVVLGHIDHGKTSLLQAIRKIQFTGEKPGGVITQHIGAYQVAVPTGRQEKDGKKITFIDTPGHEAFSQMRSRGAKVADIAVLVVDTTQGVQAQTKEVISQTKLAGIPIIVALNKIDIPGANPEKTKGELSKEGVLVESLGGKVPQVLVSAKTGQGIEDLLELILLVAEMEDLKTDISKSAEGAVIESYLDSQRGPTATLLLTEGIFKKGDTLGTPSTFGKIKSLESFRGVPIEKALPSDPIIVVGFENVPKVGEGFKVFPGIEEAKSYLKISEKKAPEVLEISAGQKVLNLILKSDVLGSIEAIEEVLRGLPQEKVILRILKSEVGEVSERDIKLAKGGRAVILGFRVKISKTSKILAERNKIKIMTFEIIYDLVEGVRKFMEKIVEPESVRMEVGKVKVLAIFLAEKNRQIVGGKVTEGEVRRGVQIEIFRGGEGENEELVGKGRLINLQRNKKDIERIPKGEECGILYEGEAKIELGDTLVIYTEERLRPALRPPA